VANLGIHITCPSSEEAEAGYRLAPAPATRHHREMHVHASSRSRTRRERASAPLGEPAMLALQQTVGNQAVVRMLAREQAPSHVGIEPVTDIGGKKGEEVWAAELAANKGVKHLYSELATLLHATKIDHVKGTSPDDINGALRADAGELKPGLNFAARMGGRGLGGYLYDGKFTSDLPPVTRKGALPTVAVVLGRGAFEGNSKASTLGVLRHELEHAFHNEMALKAITAWRNDSSKAGKLGFSAWLEKADMAATDKALVRERVSGSNTNTEALSNLEGFIAAFPLETPGFEGGHAAYVELEDAAGYWLGADAAVQKEFVARIKALRGRLKDTTGLDAALRKLKAGNKAYAPIADGALK
jgi:hypothetical protein